MIIDKISNWQSYPFGPAWKLSFDFLKSVTVDSAEKKYKIQNDEVFASVTSYKTRAPENSLLEAHRKFVDVHLVVDGGEIIECFSSDGLVISSIYDEGKDAQFYKRVSPGLVRVQLLPGSFITFFPDEVHMPSLMINGKSETVKKVVVK
ncbi:MAG: YhcH/YjgK/YiaL family protein, partial [Candidatus Omnitrophica bacterium]|nr:YhcH/YjgK/YiaL family protein [Candidatus Omnitrophota bacterium]